jgi:DeoR/GlpR family transcriptional regulator of sugar metabolism
VSFIKDKGRVSIKDVASIITDVSEKTLQRELLSLVDEGELLKVGERRWSTYEVAPGT